MEIIRIDTSDFVMSIHCHHIETLLQRARRKIKDLEFATGYSFTGAVGKACFYLSGTHEISSKGNLESLCPVFFENSDYIIDVQFHGQVEKPRIYSRLREVTTRFINKNRGGIQTITGTLNFGNDIGKYDLVLRYEAGRVQKEFCLSFEVFPLKLDYKSDYQSMINDIESEYTQLVLTFLRKTHCTFKTIPSKNNDLVWWSIFNSLYRKLLNSSKTILNEPHTRLREFKEHSKPEQIKLLSPALEERIAENSSIANKRYQYSRKKLTPNTSENQFFKFVINSTWAKFCRIKEFIETKCQERISEEFGGELNQMERELRQIKQHPFFNGIDAFKNITQESLVLQKKSGYSEIYKGWILLKRAYLLFESIQKIELKQIAELYQIWCFLQLKGIISSILGKSPTCVAKPLVQIDDFLLELKEGKTSRVEFITDDNEKVELFHELSYGDLDGLEYRSYTGKQKPDIVLRISKNDLSDQFSFTYLYDAKYRLHSDEQTGGIDFPPIDAINQMHRYRDAIYYADKRTQAKGKEVIGGYILFPGTGDQQSFQDAYFYKAIKEVNIGAFPMAPNDKGTNRVLLIEHLEGILLHKSSCNILQEVIPQKGMTYEDPEAIVFAGFCRTKEQMDYLLSEANPVYHLPVYDTAMRKQNRITQLDKLRYFAPISGGVEIIFEIDAITILPRSEVFPTGHDLYKSDTDPYYVFKLKNRKRLPKKIASAAGGNRVFRYTNLAEIRSVTTVADFNKCKKVEE